MISDRDIHHLVVLDRHDLASEIQRLYVDQRMSTKAIATRLGCGATTIRRRLVQLGVPLRTRGPYRAIGQRNWSPQLAYAVGLIATDGNLSKDGRHLRISSKDVDLLETVKQCLGLKAPIVPYISGAGAYYHHIQWSDRVFYDWLVEVGLMPNKSRQLGPLKVPSEYFADFMRGCIDGDGSIVTFTDRYHATIKSTYVYERIVVSLVSGSRCFLEWLHEQLKILLHISGHICVHNRYKERPIWQLKYGKSASIQLLRWMYYASDIPSLARKREKALKYLQ